MTKQEREQFYAGPQGGRAQDRPGDRQGDLVPEALSRPPRHCHLLSGKS